MFAFPSPWAGVASSVEVSVIAAFPCSRRCSLGGAHFRRRQPHGAFSVRDQFGRGNSQHVREPEQHNDIRTLNTSLHQADEGSIQTGGFRELLLRNARAFATFAEGQTESALRAFGRLNLLPIFGRFSGRQLNIVWGRLLLTSQI
jgi:hypothetical protein